MAVEQNRHQNAPGVRDGLDPQPDPESARTGKPLLTASRFDLARACRAPWTRFAGQWDDSAGPAAVLGKAFHKYAEELGHVSLGALAQRYGLDDDQAYRLSAMAEHWDDWAAASKVHDRPHAVEVKFALDRLSDGVTAPATEGERDYSRVPEGWVAMTADLVLYDSRRVSDYKTSGYASAPAENGQMRLLALALHRRHGWANVGADLLIFEPRGHRAEECMMGPADFAATTADLRQVALAIATGDSETAPGKHCRWCPARAACPDAASI